MKKILKFLLIKKNNSEENPTAIFCKKKHYLNELATKRKYLDTHTHKNEDPITRKQ